MKHSQRVQFNLAMLRILAEQGEVDYTNLRLAIGSRIGCAVETDTFFAHAASLEIDHEVALRSMQAPTDEMRLRRMGRPMPYYRLTSKGRTTLASFQM